MAAFLAVVSFARAGSFAVKPVRLHLTARAPIAVLTVANQGNEKTVVQASFYVWSQHEGKNVYVPTKALIVTPPITSIPPGEEQLLRVGLRHPQALPVEQSYRLFVHEIPPPPEPGFQGLQVALRISIPVFVAPAGKPEKELSWTLMRAGPHKLKLRVRNTGNVHVELLRLSLAHDGEPLKSSGQSLMLYALPGATRSRTIRTEAVLPPAGGTIRLTALSDQGPFEATVRLEP